MPTLNVNQIMQHLPHRYPFLLIDRVLDYEGGHCLTAIKNVSINEPFFNGHFPHKPVLPGVLIIEALAQATGILGFATLEQEGESPSENFIYMLVSVDKARFKRQVVPGDQLELYVELERRKRGMWRFKAIAKVDGNIVTTATLMCAGREIEP